VIETGIPRLDDFLGGGIPNGKTLLYYIEPGVEGDVFGMQTLYHNLQKGYKGLFITSTTAPDILRESFKELGFDMSQFEDRFAIIDAYSSIIGAASNERYVVEDPSDPSQIDEVISKAIEEFSGGTITFGSVSTIIDMVGEEKALEYIKKWNKYALVYDTVGIYNFTAWPYSPETLDRIKNEIFNAVIKVGGISKRVVYGQYYGVLRVDWTKTNEKAILFKLVRPGGIKAFIPKVLVTGPFNAGKSTFVHALSTRAVSADRLGTTVALDHGYVEHKGFSADIFGTPGQKRFDPIIKLLGGEALGIFLVVDSTRPEDFPRAVTMLEMTSRFGLPYVVVANKQDLEGALSLEEIRKMLDIHEDAPVVPASAVQKKGVLEAFEVLVDMVTGG